MAYLSKSIVIMTLPLLRLSSWELSLALVLDVERFLFFLRIVWISLAIFTFSLNYIREDLDKDRFLALLRRFVFSIWLLVFRGNFLILFIG